MSGDILRDPDPNDVAALAEMGGHSPDAPEDTALRCEALLVSLAAPTREQAEHVLSPDELYSRAAGIHQRLAKLREEEGL